MLNRPVVLPYGPGWSDYRLVQKPDRWVDDSCADIDIAALDPYRFTEVFNVYNVTDSQPYAFIRLTVSDTLAIWV